MKRLLLPFLFFFAPVLMAQVNNDSIISVYLSLYNSKTPIYLNIENNVPVFSQKPQAIEISKPQGPYNNCKISIGGRWLKLNAAKDSITLSTEEPVEGNNSDFWQIVKDGNLTYTLIQSATGPNARYLNAAHNKWLNIVDTSGTNVNKGAQFKLEATPSYTTKSYFLQATGSVSGLLTLKNDNTVGNSVQPSPVKFISRDGGKNSLITFGDNLLYIDTTGGANTVKLFPTEISINNLWPFFFIEQALWQVEAVSTPANYGATYSISCELNGQRYFLNNGNYQLLNVAEGNSIIWGPDGAGLFWQFIDAAEKFEKGNLTSYTISTIENVPNPSVNQPTTDSSFSYSGGTLSLVSGSASNDQFNWQLVPNSADTNYFDIQLTSPSNVRKHIIPANIPPASGPLLPNKSTGALTVADTAFPCNGISGWGKGQGNLPQTNQPVLGTVKLFYNKAYSPQWGDNEHYWQGIYYLATTNSFASSNCVTHYSNNHPNCSNKFQSFYLTSTANYPVVPNRSTLLASPKPINVYPPLSGEVVTPLTFRTIGSNKYYIYGNADTLRVIQRNKFHPSRNIVVSYKKGGNGLQAIQGASIHESYLYIINNDSIRMYTLMGLQNGLKGFIYKNEIGSNLHLSPPVYNPVSHQLFGMAQNGIVYGFGKSLFGNPFTIIDTASSSSPELFIRSINDTITHLYYVNKRDSLVRLRANSSSIQKDGANQSVNFSELQWLRYQTKLLNYEPTSTGISVTPIKNGHVASGPIGSDSTYALFFIQDSILGGTQLSLYTGPNGAFPTFPGLASISEVTYNATTSMKEWSILDTTNHQPIWMQDAPLVFYDAASKSFSIEFMAKKSSTANSTKLYTLNVAMSEANLVPVLFNLEWQRLAGEKTKELRDGSPLYNWFNFNWMKYSDPFE